MRRLVFVLHLIGRIGGTSFLKPITECNQAKPKQFRITFDTQLKTTLTTASANWTEEGTSVYSCNEFEFTLTSGLANFLLLPTMVRNDWYTSSSANLSWKQAKFSCSLRIPRSLYDSMDRQKARSRHCRSVLREKRKKINK